MSDQSVSAQPSALPAITPRLRRILADGASLASLYAVGGFLGFATLVLLFKAGVLNAIDVLFFRGLVLAGFAFLAVFGLLLVGLGRWPRRHLGARDAFSAAVLSLSFNICFLVVIPVTVDRSISVFVLGEMNADSGHLFSSDEMSALFTRVYIGDYRQIDRRMHEQTVTGNVERIGERYRISPRGRRFIATSRLVVWLFGGDARLASPAEANARTAGPLRP